MFEGSWFSMTLFFLFNRPETEGRTGKGRVTRSLQGPGFCSLRGCGIRLNGGEHALRTMWSGCGRPEAFGKVCFRAMKARAVRGRDMSAHCPAESRRSVRRKPWKTRPVVRCALACPSRSGGMAGGTPARKRSGQGDCSPAARSIEKRAVPVPAFRNAALCPSLRMSGRFYLPSPQGGDA